MVWGWKAKKGVRLRITQAVLVPIAALLVMAAGARAMNLPRSVLKRDLSNPRAAVSRFLLQRFSFPAGSTSVFFPGNDIGQAPGQLVTSSGISHPLVLIGRTVFDYYGQLGQGAFGVMSPLGYVGGQLGGHPAFDQPGQPPVTLDIQGEVTAATLGKTVGVTASGTLGPEAMLWDTGTGGTWNLGAARIGGMNVLGDIVGGADDGNAWWARSVRGTITVHELGWKGFLNHVNDQGLAVGYQTLRGGPEPVQLNLNTGRKQFYVRPPGFAYGSALDVSDVGTTVVNLFRTYSDYKRGDATPTVYPRGLRPPVIIATLPIVGLVGIKLVTISGVTDGGITFGSARQGSFVFAIRMHPLPILLKMSELDDIIDDEEYDPVVSDHALFHLENAYDEIEHGHLTRACVQLADADDVLDGETFNLEHSTGPTAAAELAYYDDIEETLWDLEDELGCESVLSNYHPLDLSSLQSPYP